MKKKKEEKSTVEKYLDLFFYALMFGIQNLGMFTLMRFVGYSIITSIVISGMVTGLFGALLIMLFLHYENTREEK